MKPGAPRDHSGKFLLLAALSALIGCTPEPAKAPSRHAPRPDPAEPSARPRSTQRDAKTQPDSEATAEPAPQTENPAADVANPALAPFAPQNFTPPSERSAQPGDGQWQPWALPESASPREVSLFRSVVHPHEVSRFISMQVVAIDLRRLNLHWTLGVQDVPAVPLGPELQRGLVPQALHADTVAVFNGGFQPQHGRWGIVAHGVTLQELKDDGCVIALRAARTRTDANAEPQVALGSWQRLNTPGDQFVTLRQTPPCLLEEGTVHPDLVAGRSRPWGGKVPGERTRRRSALGIDASGHTLYYAVGSETEALDLARGMQAAGAVTALQLDINWYWTRFLLSGAREDGQVRAQEPLISGMEFTRNEYFARASDRDFFYLVERQ